MHLFVHLMRQMGEKAKINIKNDYRHYEKIIKCDAYCDSCNNIG